MRYNIAVAIARLDMIRNVFGSREPERGIYKIFVRFELNSLYDKKFKFH